MGLGHQVPAISKGGSKTHIRHDGQGFPHPRGVTLEATQMTEIDSGRGQDFGLRRKVGGRKAERPSAVLTLDHFPSSAKGPAEKQCGLLDVAHCQQFANSRRIDVTSFDLHLGHHRHGETEMRSALGEHAHRSFPITPEMEVVTHIDLDRTNAFMDVMTDEMLWAQLREFAIEGLGDHSVEPQPIQCLDLLFERIE